MEAKRKEILALMLAMLPAATFGLGACSFDGVHTPGKTPGEITNPGENTEQQFRAAVDEVNGILSDAKESLNFTVEQNDATGKTVSKFAKDKSSVTEDGKTTYFSTAEGNNFVYSYKNNEWEKNYTNQTTKKLAGAVLDDLQSINWTELNGSKLQGTMSKESVQAETVDGGVFYTFHDGSNINLTAVNATEVTLPNENEKVDPTVDPEKDADMLFNEVNGKKQYNLPLIKQTIQNWFKETDYYTKDLNHDRVEASLDEIVYFNINSEKSQNEFGAYVTDENNKRFQTFRFKSDLDKAFNDGNIKSAKDLTNYLDGNRDKHPIAIEGFPVSIEQSITQQDLEKIWNNIQDRLKNVGVQSSSINDPGVKTTEFENVKLVTGFIKPWSEIYAGMDMGFIQTTAFMGFIIDENGNANKVIFSVQAKTNANTPQENLIIGKDFIISEYSTQEVNLVEDFSKT